jgi:hypothetical protein
MWFDMFRLFLIAVLSYCDESSAYLESPPSESCAFASRRLASDVATWAIDGGFEDSQRASSTFWRMELNCHEVCPSKIQFQKVSLPGTVGSSRLFLKSKEKQETRPELTLL